jgi:protein-L-isoaspartate(D-aspartate) O-methyltransferase
MNNTSQNESSRVRTGRFVFWEQPMEAKKLLKKRIHARVLPWKFRILRHTLQALKDTYRHKGLRKKLVDELRRQGISNEDVLEAIGALPRHFFLDKAFEEHAYENKPFPIGNEQTISQPYTVAYQTHMLQVKRRDKILEIGTGSGYQAAILSMLGARVFTIERQEDLYKKTRGLLDALGFSRIRMYYRDGFKGLPEFAPFDGILVTAGAEKIPQALFDQLAVGGRFVIPFGKERQQMLCLTKTPEGKPEILEEGGYFRFVPFLEGTNDSKK